MDISSLYVELLKNPISLQTYRQLQAHYASQNMQHEADAFTLLLQECFNVLPDWDRKSSRDIANLNSNGDPEQ